MSQVREWCPGSYVRGRVAQLSRGRLFDDYKRRTLCPACGRKIAVRIRRLYDGDDVYWLPRHMPKAPPKSRIGLAGV